MKKLSQMTVSEYLANLREQVISDDTILARIQLLDRNEISVLEGSTTEHQQVKAVHDLLRECEGEKSDLLCRYLLQNLVFQSTYDLHERITHLTGNPSVRKMFELTKTKHMLDNYINDAQVDLFKSNFMLNAWNSLSKKEKAVVLSISGSVVLGLTMNSISLKAGGGIPAAGPGVLGHGVRTGAAQRAQMLNDIRQGISSNARITAGSPGRKVVNKAPAVIRDVLRANIKQSVQPKLIAKGGKGFASINKGIKPGKTSGKSRAALILTFGVIGALSGGANVQAHKEREVILSYSEWLDVFFRGFIEPLVSVNPHSEQVDQYLKEKAIADQLAEKGTKFLEAFPQFDVYVVGLGQLSENKNKGELTAVPGFSYVNLDQERPDLGEKDLVSEPFRLGSPLGKVKIHYKKSRRAPTLLSSATEFICVPEFDAAKEVAHSGLDDMAPYHCKDGFALRNKTRAANLAANVYFDLSLTNKGKIIASRKDTNIVDASQIPGVGLYYLNNLITTTSTAPDGLEIEAYNIHGFIGRPNLEDRVVCSPPLIYVAAKGGAGVGLADELHNCPNGLLSPYTYVHSGLPESHQYDIDLGNGTIDINLLKAKNVNLKFNLSAKDLLTRIVIRCNESRENGFVKLALTIDETEVTLHLLKSAEVILSDNQGYKIFFQANEPDSFFLILEQITENVSSEEKLQACHAFQQRTLEDEQLACLMVNVTKKETGVMEDIFFIDEAGQGWIFIAEETDFIPFYGKGVYSLTASELQKNPRLAISFPVANINYYKDRNDLVLVSKGYTFAEFFLRLKNYYVDPLWNSLRIHIINMDTEARFDCDTGEHCLSGQALEGYSREAISLEDEIKTREQRLFTYYSLTPETNVASQIIYHNQQLSDSGEWQTVTEKEKRFGYLKVEGFNPTDIQVLAEGSDLIFRIKTVLAGNHTFEFRFKNWDHASSHRIEGFIFSGLSSDSLSGFLSKDVALVERRLKKAVMKAKAYDEAIQLLGPLESMRLKALLVDKLFATQWPSLGSKKTIIANSLGFQDETDLANFYFISTVSQGKNSASKFFNSEAALQKTTQALYWLAVHTCFVSNDSTMVKKLFPMLTSPEAFTSRRSFCQQVYASFGTPSSSSIEQFIQAEITPECLEGVKNWLMEASNAEKQISFFYEPISIVQQQTNLDGFTLPSVSSSDSDTELSDFIYHSRYTENELSGTERRGFIDLTNTPGIVRVHVSWEAEWFKFTFISNNEFNYRPMWINWVDTNQRIEGIVKDGDIIVEGLTAFEDVASIESAINTGLSAKIELRVGTQVHPAYRQEEQMLGDQPASGFILEENYAAYSTEPPLIGTDSSSPSSGKANIAGEVNVNTTLLASDMIVRYITGNTYSPPTQTISPESQKEVHQQALIGRIGPAIVENKNWEQPESETSAGFWDNWTTRIATIVGGLTVGVFSIAGIVASIYRSRKKNLTTNDIEKGVIIPLNPSNTNNVGNDEYSLNSIPPNECAALFGEDEERGGSEGSSSLPFSNHWFAQANDCDMKIQPQKKTVKAYSEERVA